MKMNVAHILAGRRESELLAFPSVRRMADILAERCREQSWVRTSVATLERFRTMTGQTDLELLLTQAQSEPSLAEESLRSFAQALTGYTESQVSGLAMGAKLWFRLNSINVPWRPLPGVQSSPPLALSKQEEANSPTSWANPTSQPSQANGEMERVLLLGLIGSGLQMAELLRLHVCDVGSLDSEGHLIPDIESDPLAVQYTPRRGKQGERITFLTYAAQQALLRLLTQHNSAQSLAADALIFSQQSGNRESTLAIAQARRRSQALIRAGSDVNVALCRATGDFFREWGLPGSRFEGEDDLNIEEFI